MANYPAGATGNNPLPLPSTSNVTPLSDAEKIEANLLISAANVLLQSRRDAGVVMPMFGSEPRFEPEPT